MCVNLHEVAGNDVTELEARLDSARCLSCREELEKRIAEVKRAILTRITADVVPLVRSASVPRGS
jgi:NAD-dependent SIR2 family protein deacetylase